MGNGTTNTNTSGEASVAFDFVRKGGSDCVSDKNMAEIIRRLVGSVKSDETGAVVFSVNPPNDKKKIWVRTSAAGGIIGTIKRFDSASGQWVDDHTVIPDPPEPKEYKNFTEVHTLGSDDETFVLNHNFGTNDYLYQVVFTSNPSPNPSPSLNGRWYEVNKATNSLELKFLDANGASFRVTIWEVDF